LGKREVVVGAFEKASANCESDMLEEVGVRYSLVRLMIDDMEEVILLGLMVRGMQ